MADWPDTDELAQVLNIAPDANIDDWQTTLDRVLASAIAQVKIDVGCWDEYEDEPTDKMAQAALRMGELIGLRPEAVAGLNRSDPTYLQLLAGERRKFSIA